MQDKRGTRREIFQKKGRLLRKVIQNKKQITYMNTQQQEKKGSVPEEGKQERKTRQGKRQRSTMDIKIGRK